MQCLQLLSKSQVFGDASWSAAVKECIAGALRKIVVLNIEIRDEMADELLSIL